jgi:hypothetical protein
VEQIEIEGRKRGPDGEGKNGRYIEAGYEDKVVLKPKKRADAVLQF